MTGHVLVVEADPSQAALDNMRRLWHGLPPLEAATIAAEYHRWHIECLAPERCDGWLECIEDHDTGESDPDEEEHREFHGLEHTWRYAIGGWTLPYPGCVVDGMVVDPLDALPCSPRPGRWLVEDGWFNEQTMYLNVIREIEEATP